MTSKEKIEAAYYELMNSLELNENDVDYSIWEQQKPIVQQLAALGNNGITVFDFARRGHIFVSYSFHSLFGYDMKEIEKEDTAYFDSRIHPDDWLGLIQNAVSAFYIFFTLPVEVRKDYKMIVEYRILNAAGKYVRIIEQQQVLELDRNGKVWLGMSVLDVSPNQEPYEGVKSQALNYKTGELLPILPDIPTGVELSDRQKEILRLIKEGFLSKEISEKLSISVHTVNTHRQHILEKLGVDNSLEAVQYATRLGLIS